jgi:hypothetical protein
MRETYNTKFTDVYPFLRLCLVCVENKSYKEVQTKYQLEEILFQWNCVSVDNPIQEYVN